MTEGVFESLRLNIDVGCYGHFLCELRDLNAASRQGIYCGGLSLGSDGLDHTDFNDYYPRISRHETPAAALRAFADRLDVLFGDKQLEAMRAWQQGDHPGKEGYAAWIRAYGTPAAIAALGPQKEVTP